VTRHIGEKSKLCFLITMHSFSIRKGMYQMRIFVYKIVKISKHTPHCTTFVFKFPDEVQDLLTFKIALTAGKLRSLFVLRVKRICHPRRNERVQALTSLQRSSLTSVCSVRYRPSAPHTSGPAHAVPSYTTSALLKYSDWRIYRNVYR
jgi:hypothetical protein